MAPPTPQNLAALAAARASGRGAGGAFAVQACEGALRAELAAGDALFIPGGHMQGAGLQGLCPSAVSAPACAPAAQ